MGWHNMLIEIALTIGSILLSAWIGSVQYKVRKMEQDISLKIDKTEVRELIEDKLEAHGILLEDVRNDVEKLIDKLDRFLFSGPR